MFAQILLRKESLRIRNVKSSSGGKKLRRATLRSKKRTTNKTHIRDILCKHVKRALLPRGGFEIKRENTLTGMKEEKILKGK